MITKKKISQVGRFAIQSPKFWLTSFLTISVTAIAVFPAVQVFDDEYVIGNTITTSLNAPTDGTYDSVRNKIVIANDGSATGYDVDDDYSLNMDFAFPYADLIQYYPTGDQFCIVNSGYLNLISASDGIYADGISLTTPETTITYNATDLKIVGDTAYVLAVSTTHRTLVLLKYNIAGDTIEQLGSATLVYDRFDGYSSGTFALNDDASIAIASGVGHLAHSSGTSGYQPIAFAIDTDAMEQINFALLGETANDSPFDDFQKYKYATGGIAIYGSSAYVCNHAKGQVQKLTFDSDGVFFTSPTYKGLEGPFDAFLFNGKIHIANIGSTLINGGIFAEGDDTAGIGDSITVINPVTDQVERTVSNLSSPRRFFSGNGTLYLIQGPATNSRDFGTFSTRAQVSQVSSAPFRTNAGMFGPRRGM